MERLCYGGCVEIIRIPILKIEDFLVASIQTTRHDVQAMDFKDSLLQRIYDIREIKAKGFTLDLTVIDVLDSFVGRLIKASHLMGAQVVITGLQPAVAMNLVELGRELPRVLTGVNLEKRIAALGRVTELAAHG